MNRQFWQGRRVFLTGHTGFKGSWLCLWLQSLGAKVTGYALSPTTTPNLFEVAGVARGMTTVLGDVRDLRALQSAMSAAKPEIIFHMAAQALVKQSYDDPVGTYATNVLGTVHLLEAVRHTPSALAVVNVTSDKCYENKEWPWNYRENDRLGGADPYSNSKGCSELVTAAYRQSFFQKNIAGEQPAGIATARAGNVIGGGDWSRNRLVPDVLSALERGDPVMIRNPSAIRPWQHVLEPLHGYLTLAERLAEQRISFAEGWNFGPRDEDTRSVAWIVEHMCGLWGHGASWQLDEAAHQHEAKLLALTSVKAHDRLGWRPRWTLPLALQKTVEWQRGWLQGEDAALLCGRQIGSFQDCLA